MVTGETASLVLDVVPAVQKVTIPPLALEATIDVKVRGEKLREADETFLVKLLLPKGAVLTDDTGRGTIVNDDVRPGRQ